jgi:hypothetical protein
MVFASAKDALRRSLNGIHAEVHASEPEELSFENGMFLVIL